MSQSISTTFLRNPSINVFTCAPFSKVRIPRWNRLASYPMVALAMVSFPSSIHAQLMVDLGSAASFGVLAGSTITDAAGLSLVHGNVGLYPAAGSAIGLSAGQVLHGSIYTSETSGPLLNTAQIDLTIAYNDAAGRTPTFDYGAVDNPLGGQTLFPGVYRFGHAATANLIGTLTLDAHGIVNPVWIFQATSDFITAAGAPGSPASRVVLMNGARAQEVFWQVGSSATLGTYSDLAGTILADQSITLGTGTQLEGAALARIAAVNLNDSFITNPLAVPEPQGAAAVAGILMAFALIRRAGTSRASCP
jgi:hypothetical protein